MDNNIANINDLNIKTDILEIFDNTLHTYSRDRLLDMLITPLQNIDAINNRQQILRGFLANKKLLERYFYQKLDFSYAHELLTKPDNRKLKFRFKLRLLLNKAKRNAAMGTYIQLILFLQQHYTLISTFIDTDTFPDPYKSEINSLKKYFQNFELDFFSTRIRERKFKIAHIVAIQKKINELQETETNDFFNRLFTFESLLSISISIHKRGFTFPCIGDPVFSIKGVYHPLLPEPIRNNISLDKQVVLITGPNMAGKSTFLKAIALSVYLGHLGFAIPAAEAKFPFFQNICIYINHTDNLRLGYSHFLHEVKNLKEVALKAAKGTPTFAIFDEIFKGTNMNDALQITRTTAQGLAQFHQSVFFISTHMDELKDMASTAVNSYFLDCKVKDGIPKFNYQLKEGWSSVQIGKILFKNEGLYDLFQPPAG